MAINFIDSETCQINSDNMIYFMHPDILRDRIIEIVEKNGAKKFFSSPSESTKNMESFAEYFFTIALKKVTGQDHFLMQPKQDPPDFLLMTASADQIILDQFELVQIPDHCRTFDEMMDIIQTKINKGYPDGYSLLVFVNNEKSDEWIKLLHGKLENYRPFKAIWTMHLMWYKGKKDLYGSVVNKLRPYPAKSIRVALNDGALRQKFSIPNYMEELKIEGKTFISIRSDFVKELIKKLRKINLYASEIKNNEQKVGKLVNY